MLISCTLKLLTKFSRCFIATAKDSKKMLNFMLLPPAFFTLLFVVVNGWLVATHIVVVVARARASTGTSTST